MWSSNYRMSCIDGEPANEMEVLMDWLPRNIPEQPHPTCTFYHYYMYIHINAMYKFILAGIVHGDYRPENVVFHPTEVRTNDQDILFIFY